MLSAIMENDLIRSLRSCSQCVYSSAAGSLRLDLFSWHIYIFEREMKNVSCIFTIMHWIS